MNDFPHAFLVVFRIQCGEWIQNMWECMDSVSHTDNNGLVPFCVMIFIGVVFVGNLVVSKNITLRYFSLSLWFVFLFLDRRNI